MFLASLEALGHVALAAAVAYAGLVLILRVAGKRSLAKLNAFDFAVTVAIGSTLATVLLSKDVALADGLLAFAMLALLQYTVTKASVLWNPFKRLVRSRPRRLVANGRYLDAALADERVTRSEVDAAIRKRGFGRLDRVAAVVLETDGGFSVIGVDDAGPLLDLGSARDDRTER